MFASVVASVPAQTNPINPIDGRELFTNVRKGNCVACHPLPGSAITTSSKVRIGPDLAGITGRYPDRARLRAILWDASDKSADTIMPPYGKHRILTETEIDAVVRYLETL